LAFPLSEFNEVNRVNIHGADSAAAKLEPMSCAGDIDKQVVLFGVGAEELCL